VKEGLSRFLERDRAIKGVQIDPHEKIEDQELRELWHEMRWRRNVKANLFVSTLRDHFRDTLEEAQESIIFPFSDSSDDNPDDSWAKRYIGTQCELQQIKEVFDDDGSGYITINGVNRFLRSLPAQLDWSLPRWVACSIIGRQLTTAYYSNKIRDIFAIMFGLRRRLQPENQYWVDYYLCKVWPDITKLTMATRETELFDHIFRRFKEYVKYEEQRIKKNLDDIRYDIDAFRTVSLVAGPGRFEKNILPLIYLLLKRDLKKFRIAQGMVLRPDELWDSADTLLWVLDAVVLHVQDLTGNSAFCS